MTPTLTLAEELHRAVGADHVRPEPGQPDAWRVEPGAPAEVAEVVRAASRHRAAVVPVGSGSRPPRVRALGDRPRVHVATTRLDQVIHLDETSLLCHVQAGITGLGLEKVLSPRGLSLGDYPPSILGSTIGGLVAVRTPGKSSARHGFFEDAVVGLSAVLADGRTIHTRLAPRRATGPDLARALCGSEGTLGFITTLVLRIHRRAEARFLAAYVLPSIDGAVAATYLALREEAAPAGLRILDAAEARHWFGAGVVRDDEAVVVAATAGPTDLAACDRDLIASAVRAEGGRAADVELAELWWKRRLSAEPWPGPPPMFQVTATPSKLRGAYHAVCGAVRSAGAFPRAHISRFDADGAVVFVTFVDAKGAPLTGGAAEKLKDVAEAAARAAGGWLLGARSRELDPYLHKLRAILDPDGIMNPGALVG
ncbi:MAG TPA: FAD-binding oxidoreductase [Kofleriaceae bacterium]|jgi:alkyldihydroxyacetonephosphate synthase|nr:FAD-binding oxidoreductase [Kofleriaceae bacterium]